MNPPDQSLTTAQSAPRNFGQWKILTICANREFQAQIAQMFTEYMPYSATLALSDYPTRNVLVEAVQDQGANICFVDVDTNRENALALLSDLVAIDPKLPVIGLHSGNDPDYILRTLRSGATEFLIRPFTSEHFVPVMERISAMHRSRPGSKQAKVCCVMPAKGACGASTISCNLAHYWKKLGAGRVLLADLDPLTGTISFQLKMKQNYNFMEFLNRSGEMDEDVWKGMVQSNAGLDVMLAPEQPVHGIDEMHNAGTLIEFARTMYDSVIIDTNGVYGTWNLSLARLCDELLLVTTNELPALQATQRSLAYLDRNRVERGKVRIVVNRYHRDVGLSRDIIEAALHCDVYHLIPSDYEALQRSLVEGKSIAQNTPVGKGVLALAERLAGKEFTPPAPKTSSISNLFGFLKR